MRVISYSTNDKQAKMCSEVGTCMTTHDQQMICLQLNRQDMRQQNH